MPPCTCDRPMTYLELVNEVLKRLREPEVSGLGSKYSKLIGALVNDGKRAVEDAANWVQLFEEVSVTTTSGTADYNLTGTNDRTTVFSVVNDNSKASLTRKGARWLVHAKQTESSNGTPDCWGVVGSDANGLLTLRLYPTPSGAFDFTVSAYVPDADLVATTDTISVPSEPVFMYAYAMAIKERGEDNGASYREALQTYKNVLGRYLVLNGHSQGPKQWQVL